VSAKSSDIAGGRVSEVPFARIFGTIARRRLTGILRLEQDSRRFALYFNDGAVADADSSHPEDTLGRVALEAGLIEREAVGDSLRRMAQDATKSQKDALVELGALRGDALERALRLTLTRRTLRVFNLPTAQFTFEELAHNRLEGGPVEPRWSVYRGLRMHYDERRLDLEMSGTFAGQAFRISVDPAEIYDAFGFSNDERMVINYLDRARTNGFYWELGDLVDACMTLPRATVLAVVHALHAFENIELRPAASVTRYRKARREPTLQIERQTLEIKPPPSGQSGQVPSIRFTPPTGAPINNPARGAPTERNPAVAPSTASPAFTPPQPRANGTNPPVPPFTNPRTDSSSGQAVPVQKRGTNPNVPPPGNAQRTGVGPASVRPSGPTTILGPAGNLRGSAPSPPTPGAKRASAPTIPFSSGNQRVVTEPGAGVSSSHSPVGGRPGAAAGSVTREQIAAKLAEVDRNVDHFILLEIQRNATIEEAKAAYFTLAKLYHPDKLSAAKLEQMKPQVGRIFTRLTEAYAALSDEGRRSKYLRVLAEGGEDAARRRDDEASAEASRILIAEEHFKRGEMALRRSSYAAAIEEFQSAIELNNTEAEYHAALGWAKWCNASDKHAILTEVKTDFSKALKLDNKCVDAVFYRGRMYKDLGEPESAEKAFRKVLSINEDHLEAKSEIRLIELRKERGATGFFDLFRKKPKPPGKA
jgi:tetratricopeptide (TPR) repeat protein